jgi:prepilin signal peptidase PulO-like enzyme (type II secretory pathway)
MNVLKVYRSLSAEQKQILADKQIDLKRPVAELLALLKPVASCDQVADKARTPLGCTIALSIVLTIILIVIAGNIESKVLFIGAAVVGSVVFIGSIVLFRWTRKIDVSNNMRSFALPALAVLKEDFDPQTPVHVKLDLRPPTDDAKKKSEGEPYKAGVYYKIIDSVYVDPWMTFEGVLTDGTKLWWSVTDTIRERKKTKKNPRGKIKTKTKYKKVTEIDVEMGMKNKTYAVGRPAEGEVEAGDKRNTVRVAHRVVSATIDPIPPRELIDVVAGVYRNARPAGKEA